MADVVKRLGPSSFDRTEVQNAAWSAAASVYRTPTVTGYQPMGLRDFNTQTGINWSHGAGRRPSGAFDSYAGKLNDLLGVRYLIVIATAPTVDLGAYRVFEQ